MADVFNFLKKKNDNELDKLNAYKDYVRQFEIESGFNRSTPKELLELLEDAVNNLKVGTEGIGKAEQEYLENKMLDVIILVLQIANRYHANLDGEWVKHWQRSEKYRTRKIK